MPSFRSKCWRGAFSRFSSPSAWTPHRATMSPDRDATRQSWAVWSAERQGRIEDVLERVLAPNDSTSSVLQRAMRYAVLDGGKRVRPLLAYAAGDLAGAAPDVVDSAAAAVELIHGYSLVHDDLP